MSSPTSTSTPQVSSSPPTTSLSPPPVSFSPPQTSSSSPQNSFSASPSFYSSTSAFLSPVTPPCSPETSDPILCAPSVPSLSTTPCVLGTSVSIASSISAPSVSVGTKDGQFFSSGSECVAELAYDRRSFGKFLCEQSVVSPSDLNQPSLSQIPLGDQSELYLPTTYKSQSLSQDFSLNENIPTIDQKHTVLHSGKEIADKVDSHRKLDIREESHRIEDSPVSSYLDGQNQSHTNNVSEFTVNSEGPSNPVGPLTEGLQTTPRLSWATLSSLQAHLNTQEKSYSNDQSKEKPTTKIELMTLSETHPTTLSANKTKERGFIGDILLSAETHSEKGYEGDAEEDKFTHSDIQHPTHSVFNTNEHNSHHFTQHHPNPLHFNSQHPDANPLDTDQQTTHYLNQHDFNFGYTKSNDLNADYSNGDYVDGGYLNGDHVNGLNLNGDYVSGENVEGNDLSRERFGVRFRSNSEQNSLSENSFKEELEEENSSESSFEISRYIPIENTVGLLGDEEEEEDEAELLSYLGSSALKNSILKRQYDRLHADYVATISKGGLYTLQTKPQVNSPSNHTHRQPHQHSHIPHMSHTTPFDHSNTSSYTPTSNAPPHTTPTHADTPRSYKPTSRIDQLISKSRQKLETLESSYTLDTLEKPQTLENQEKSPPLDILGKPQTLDNVEKPHNIGTLGKLQNLDHAEKTQIAVEGGTVNRSITRGRYEELNIHIESRVDISGEREKECSQDDVYEKDDLKIKGISNDVDEKFLLNGKIEKVKECGSDHEFVIINGVNESESESENSVDDEETDDIIYDGYSQYVLLDEDQKQQYDTTETTSVLFDNHRANETSVETHKLTYEHTNSIVHPTIRGPNTHTFKDSEDLMTHTHPQISSTQKHTAEHAHTPHNKLTHARNIQNTKITHTEIKQHQITLQRDTQTDTQTDVHTDQHTDKQAFDVPTNIPTDVPTDKQTDIQTDIQADIQTDVQTDIQGVRQTDVQTNLKSDVQTDEQTDKQTVVQKGTKTGLQTETHTDKQTDLQQDIERDVSQVEGQRDGKNVESDGGDQRRDYVGVEMVESENSLFDCMMSVSLYEDEFMRMDSLDAVCFDVESGVEYEMWSANFDDLICTSSSILPEINMSDKNENKHHLTPMYAIYDDHIPFTQSGMGVSTQKIHGASSKKSQKSIRPEPHPNRHQPNTRNNHNTQKKNREQKSDQTDKLQPEFSETPKMSTPLTPKGKREIKWKREHTTPQAYTEYTVNDKGCTYTEDPTDPDRKHTHNLEGSDNKGLSSQTQRKSQTTHSNLPKNLSDLPPLTQEEIDLIKHTMKRVNMTYVPSFLRR